jgi:hypothetical protein
MHEFVLALAICLAADLVAIFLTAMIGRREVKHDR